MVSLNQKRVNNGLYRLGVRPSNNVQIRREKAGSYGACVLAAAYCLLPILSIFIPGDVSTIIPWRVNNVGLLSAFDC